MTTLITTSFILRRMTTATTLCQDRRGTLPPPPRLNRTGTKLVAGAVVFVLIVVVLLVAAFAVQSLRTAGSSAPSSEVAVTITGVDWVFNGATNCWSSLTDPSTYSLLSGQQFTTTWVLDYNAGWFQPSTCTITSVSVQTVGFSLVSDNVPFVVRSGGSQTISVTVSTPGTAFTGVLTLDATVTSP